MANSSGARGPGSQPLQTIAQNLRARRIALRLKQQSQVQ
jgi:hypothetical protein